ncbi:MAG: DUF6048 family protein [Bacteroidales bacterium]
MKTYVCSILLILLLFSTPSNSCAQDKKTEASKQEQVEIKAKKEIEPKHRRFFAPRIGTNILKPLMGMYSYGEDSGIEIMADYEFVPNWFIATELGHEKFGINNSYIDLEGNGQYFKIGTNLNILKDKKQDARRHSIEVIMRYAFSTNSQRVNSITHSNYWGEATNTNYPNQKFSAQWGELGLGLKAEIFKNFFMGWEVRAMMIVSNPDIYPNAFRVAGFGQHRSLNVAIGYSFMYLLPFHLGKQKGQAIEPVP